MNKARLVFATPNPLLEPSEPNWEGCEYSKCGRTDKGVSAFGQVIGIRVRSNRPVNRAQTPTSTEDLALSKTSEENLQSRNLEIASALLGPASNHVDNESSTPSSTSDSWTEEALAFHPIKDEIPYCQVLNRLLPPDIRMLAWCPAPPVDFSARFSCKERRYKYFFTQPAFAPTVGSTCLVQSSEKAESAAKRRREGWIDIEAMREAAHKFVGLHDFRNLCKTDASKQIDNFERRIFHADIEKLDPHHSPVGYVGEPGFQEYEPPDDPALWHSVQGVDIRGQPSTPSLYTFTLHGSAFLWHQVRHMVGILFLIGQGLESPSLVDELLDIQKTPCKPQYEMADDAPLVLWDCIFPREGSGSREDALEWIYVGDYSGEENGVQKAGGKANGDGKYGFGGVVDDMWRVWRGRKMDEVLAGTLLDVVVGQGRHQSLDLGTENHEANGSGSQKVFQGADAPRLVGKYIPVMRRQRMESVEAINAKYAKRKGFEQKEKIRDRGFRRVVVDAEDDGNE